MNLIPCDIKDIERLTIKTSAGTYKAYALAFLAMDVPAAKLDGIPKEKINASQTSLSKICRKEHLPIRAMSRADNLYMINTVKVPELAL